MTNPYSDSQSQADLNEELRRSMARKTRRSFLIGGAATAATIAAYEWLSHAKQIDMLESPLRRAEQFNAAVSRALFREKPLAPTYPIGRSTELRLNGIIGLDPHMILDSWRLQVVGLAHPEKYKQYIEDVDLWDYRSTDSPQDAPLPPEQPDSKLKPGTRVDVDQTNDQSIPKAPSSDTTRTPGIVLSLQDLRTLPFTEQVTQFKCVEGWSQITSFAGACFADFLKAYPPQLNPDGTLPAYVNMETADGAYSASHDIATLLHPQTLLCYQMNGKPLNSDHGAPLRLAMPIKYGYKQIKQIAKITYTNQRPVDFWETQGYDWYAGL
ncbi:molybdopterin-dependent oxidoreductase [Edaphobacter paludis]|uniref:Molybdopterin-dependent oxidoreductase n=1 Tax=Edaphobacter paludis TaxID=3035702 RepID=A0AAU7CV29_9BACT